MRPSGVVGWVQAVNRVKNNSKRFIGLLHFEGVVAPAYNSKIVIDRCFLVTAFHLPHSKQKREAIFFCKYHFEIALHVYQCHAALEASEVSRADFQKVHPID